MLYVILFKYIPINSYFILSNILFCLVKLLVRLNIIALFVSNFLNLFLNIFKAWIFNPIRQLLKSLLNFVLFILLLSRTFLLH